jgi:anti-sigma B factor antagonist
MPSRSLYVTVEGDKAIIRITDEALTDEGGPSSQRLPAVIDGLSQRQVTLDFEHVRVVNSLALTTLLSANKKLLAAGGGLSVVNVRPEVYEVFAVTRLNTVLQVHKKEAA